MRRRVATRVVPRAGACWRALSRSLALPRRPAPTSSARSRWSRRARSPARRTTSRPTTPTTRRSPATGATSPSTARSAASPASGGATSPRGAVEQVAGGDAELPSISENGRYVSFTTTQALDSPKTTNEADRTSTSATWNRGPGEAAVHARLGRQRLRRRPDLRIRGRLDRVEEESYGSLASGRSAISADGQRGRVRDDRAVSEPRPAPHTPALQVAVRDLRHAETELVSVAAIGTCRRTGRHAGIRRRKLRRRLRRGLLAGRAPAFDPPPPYGEYATTPPLGASISADGSTVAWMGEDIGQQARAASGRNQAAELHRAAVAADRARLGNRRRGAITGGSDPANPACVASGERCCPPPPRRRTLARDRSPRPKENCRGIWTGGDSASFVPRLSADGYTVAFIGAGAAGRARRTTSAMAPVGRPSDLYVANMHEGLTREQALTPLTELASGDGRGHRDRRRRSSTSTSPRTAARSRSRPSAPQFPLGSPAYVSAPAAEAGDERTVRRRPRRRHAHARHPGLRRRPERTPAQLRGHRRRSVPRYGDGALSPSFSDDGDDARVLLDRLEPRLRRRQHARRRVRATVPSTAATRSSSRGSSSRATPTPQYVSSAPGPALTPAWDLGVTALSRANGSVLLYVAGARGGDAARRRAERGRAPIRRRARRAQRAPCLRRACPRARARATRTVATRAATAQGAGLTTLTLALAPVLPLARGRARRPVGHGHRHVRGPRARRRCASASPSPSCASRGRLAPRLARTRRSRRSSQGGPAVDELAHRRDARSPLADALSLAARVRARRCRRAAPQVSRTTAKRRLAPGTAAAARTARAVQRSTTPIGLGRIGDIEFWAPNRGLLITAGNGSTIPPGVWAYNGVGWHELSIVCGATDGRIAWAGPEEFWTISDGRPGQAREAERTDRRRWKTTRSVTSRSRQARDRRPPTPSRRSSRPPTRRCTPPAASTPTDCWFAGEPLPEPQVGAFQLHWNGSSLDAEPYARRARGARTCACSKAACTRACASSPEDRVTTQRPGTRRRCTASTPKASLPTFEPVTRSAAVRAAKSSPKRSTPCTSRADAEALWGAAGPA